jgi:hypothetical protein
MSRYDPECWEILKITKDGEVISYKVFGGWRGGYLSGDSWKLNSGIKSFKKLEDRIDFRGFSGSVYCCRVYGENIGSGWLRGMFNNLITQAKDAGYEATSISFEDFEKEFNQQ